MVEVAKKCIEIGIIKELHEKEIISKEEMELAIKKINYQGSVEDEEWENRKRRSKRSLFRNN